MNDRIGFHHGRIHPLDIAFTTISVAFLDPNFKSNLLRNVSTVFSDTRSNSAISCVFMPLSSLPTQGVQMYIYGFCMSSPLKYTNQTY